MASRSNSLPLVVARFLLACPFLVASVMTFTLLHKKETSGNVVDQLSPITQALGEMGKDLPKEKLAVLLAVMQGIGGYLMVFNHKFGGLLLMTYLLPVTVLSHQFWKVDPSNFQEQLDVLGQFLKNIGLMGGILAFMASTDEVPLKVKRKDHME
ncbi:hypothetical protein Agub_g1575 [Astrephomene gubernaculifera]|uniref:Uncharacterized protein n=1 Tax=Astrephomene gubernaculifera TaxID=47775 RepID=A0AAD3DFK6_9CHLO|nr:hypothetical protein Agub_g1575 [Astrephomene gubernaculifera]